MGLFLESTQLKRYILVGITITTIFVLFILTSAFIIRNIFISQIRTSLTKLTVRIENDLRYQNQKWDTTLYTADPLTPHPTGSSGFVTPLYIVTTDGFVIERNQPISGLLDTSDYKRVMTFNTAQTINAITNESWRIKSKAITKGTTSYGAIMVSYFNPIEGSQNEIDEKLERNVNRILSKIQIINNHINIDKIDIRTIDYDISFEITDIFNKVILNNGRNPSFIDTSYVGTVIKDNHDEIIVDTQTNEKFLVISKTLSDKDGVARAVIVAGESIDFIDSGLLQYMPYALLLTFLGSGLGILFITKTFSMQKLLKLASTHQPSPKSISFDSEKGLLIINNEKFDIPVNSHQYKILQTLFSNPQKLWQQHEILSRFNEQETQENNRRIYDAMLAINKKLPLKLILYKEKTYRISSTLTSFISS